MKRISILVYFLFTTVAVIAQVGLLPLQYSPFGLRVNDLWRFKLLNNTTVDQEVFVGFELRLSGRVVLTSTSKVIVLKPGLNELNIDLAKPNFKSLSSMKSEGVLDNGQYNQCVNVILVSNNEPLISECFDFEQIALTPPFLVFPEDGSILESKYPLFSWTPPGPIGVYDKIKYSIKLAEIYPNQSAVDAINRNLAVLYVSGLDINSFTYPITSYSLQPEKKYAWNIIAYNNQGNAIGQTEVWTFKLAKDSLSSELPIKSFIKLKSEKTSDYVAVKDVLRIIYDERYSDTKVSIEIEDANNKIVFKEGFNIQRGENRITLNLAEIATLKVGRYYNLTVKSEGRPNLFLMFKNL